MNKDILRNYRILRNIFLLSKNLDSQSQCHLQIQLLMRLERRAVPKLYYVDDNKKIVIGSRIIDILDLRSLDKIVKLLAHFFSSHCIRMRRNDSVSTLDLVRYYLLST